MGLCGWDFAAMFQFGKDSCGDFLPHSPFSFRFLFALYRITPDVPAAQGYRVERQVGDDRPGR